MAPPGTSLARALKVWFDIIFVLGLVGGGLLTLWLVASPAVMALDGGRRVELAIPVAVGSGGPQPVLEVETGEVSEGVSSVRVVDARGELRLETTSWSLQFLTVLPAVVGIGVVLFALFLLRAILRTVIAGEPFSLLNASRLRTIGWIAVVAGVVVPVVEYAVARAVLARFVAQGVELSPPVDVNGTAVLGGLLLLVLAAVWRYGADLERERALTV